MRCLGEFVGHLWQGVASDPAPTRRVETRRESVEHAVPGAAGASTGAVMTLRRTVIEEVEIAQDPRPTP
jgi:hypothetical protein